MSDMFEEKNVAPMLLHETQPFNDENYIFELKFDGIRCIAYIAPDSSACRIGYKVTVNFQRNGCITMSPILTV